MNENEIAALVIDRGLRIHRRYGPGLLEKVYEELLCHELREANLRSSRQQKLPFIANDRYLPASFRPDLIVEKLIIIEIKASPFVHRLHKKQLLTYLKISNLKLGLVLNFDLPLLKNGIARVINGTLGS